MTLQSIKRAITQDFTYGFEIEGAFSEKIETIACKSQLKEDSTVNLQSSNLCFNTPDIHLAKNEENEENEDEIATEFASTVLRNFDEMTTSLKVFKYPDYFPTLTSGLHVHLKPKKKEIAQKLFLMLSDYSLALKTLKKFKEITSNYSQDSFCWGDNGKDTLPNGCYGERWANMYYYQPYPNKKRYMSDWQWGEKYRFYHYHSGYETIEFRLFSPRACHREQALKLMFTELLPRALYEVSKKWQGINKNNAIKIENLPIKGRVKTKIII